MSAQKEWQSDGSQSTATKFEMECNDIEASFSWKGDKFSLEAEKQLCEGDWKAEVDIEADLKPVKNENELTGKIKF